MANPTNGSKGLLLGLLAETPLHPGTGQTSGVVDLPVSRESTTRHPQQPETGLKGALKQWYEERLPDSEKRSTIDAMFGTSDEGAGEILVTTGRLLLLPVRRLDGPYAWVTTPYLIERLGRDIRRISGKETVTAPAVPDTGTIRCGFSTTTVFLEEFPFEPKPLTGADTGLVTKLKALIGSSGPVGRLQDQIAIMRDADFVWYAENALPVAARNKLSPAKTSENLWYEETLPVDTVLYAAILPRSGLQANGKPNDAGTRFNALQQALKHQPYLQIGGNETVGQGWVNVSVQEL